MIVDVELYKRMILHLAEMNNCYDENVYKNFGITWMELHDLRKEIEDEEATKQTKCQGKDCKRMAEKVEDGYYACYSCGWAGCEEE